MESRWRRQLAAHRATDVAYRLCVAVVGGAVVVVGLVAVPLPGPGWVTVLGGLVLLATEFASAQRLLEVTSRHLGRWTGWVRALPVWARLALATVGLAFTYGVTVLVLHVIGVPAWVPSWIPLWR